MSKVSVIIPAYNVEAYLPRCLDSVLCSKNQDLQIIVVDDGSNDSTPSICDEYAERDHRIEVIHKKNGGVSSARNCGLQRIIGDYVAFVDADDAVSPDYLTVDKENADVIEKPYVTIKSSGESYKTESKYRNPIRDRHRLYYYFVNHRLNALWNKIFSSSLLKGRVFDKNFANGEDMFFQISLLPNIKKYTFSSLGYYEYFTRSDSATNFMRQREVWKNYYFKCIVKLTSDSDTRSKAVRSSLLYDIYVRNMYLIFDELSADRQKIVRMLMRKMSISDLRYISPRRIVRLYWWHIKSLFK